MALGKLRSSPVASGWLWNAIVAHSKAQEDISDLAPACLPFPTPATKPFCWQEKGGVVSVEGK